MSPSTGHIDNTMLFGSCFRMWLFNLLYFPSGFSCKGKLTQDLVDLYNQILSVLPITKSVKITPPPWVTGVVSRSLWGINQWDYPSNMRSADRQLQAHYVTSMIKSTGVKGASEMSQI